MEFLEENEMPEEFTGVRINPRDVVGHLLLVWVIDYLAHKPTQYTRPDKPSDVIVVDCVDLDVLDEAQQPGLLARHTWWRQAKLIQKLKPKVGNPSPYLCRMAKGGAGTGFNAPFILNGAGDEPGAKERAVEWAARNPGFKPSTPFVENGPVNPQPQPEVETSPPRPPTILGQIAAQAQRGADRINQMGQPLPPPPPQSQVPPF